MEQLLPYILVDVVLLVTITTFSMKKITFFHPLFYYLIFHGYAISLRAIELYSGKYPMYFGMNTSAYYSAVRPEEFVRALLIADAGLLLFAIGSYAAGWARAPKREPRHYDDLILKLLLSILLPLSFVLLLSRRFGGAEAREIMLNYQLLSIMGVWPIALVSLAMARWGFKWYWVAAAVLYLVIVGTQGYHRFQALLPLIMLVGIYLAQRRYAWPGAGVWVLLLAAALVFPSLKQFGTVLNESGWTESITAIDQDQRALDNLTQSRTEMFFDQFAGSVTAAQGQARPLLGQSYLAVLTLPIPRSLWPSKPSMASATISVTVAGRPYDQEGRIITVLGESFVNFSYVGIILIMSGMGYLLSRYYFLAFSIPQLDPFKVAYIGFMTSYLQTFRDGLPSFIMFSLIAMAPLFLYLILNRWIGRRKADSILHQTA